MRRISSRSFGGGIVTDSRWRCEMSWVVVRVREDTSHSLLSPARLYCRLSKVCTRLQLPHALAKMYSIMTAVLCIILVPSYPSHESYRRILDNSIGLYITLSPFKTHQEGRE
jgi:hypothetical protein